jgi:hypothetical protein
MKIFKHNSERTAKCHHHWHDIIHVHTCGKQFTEQETCCNCGKVQGKWEESTLDAWG